LKKEKSMKNITSNLVPALWVEFQKVRHSKLLWISALAASIVALISGLFMFILKDPERARQLGLVGAKAQLLGGAADWTSFFNLAVLMLSVGGLIIFGFIFIWIFGREFGDKTVYDMLSLPTSRLDIITAKTVTGIYWSIGLTLFVFGLMLGAGGLIHLPGWSAANMLHGLGLLLGTSTLTVIVCLPFALVASISRGYLPAVGGIFLVLILGQVVSQLGYGQYFPWTIPMMYSGAAEALTGKTAAPAGFFSYFLVGIIGLSSLIVNSIWWHHADQT
jgi:ABC-2 type transport system permease protein